MRIATFAALVLAGLAAGAGSAAAYDSLGGFDQPYSNDGNVFGKGAWGDGRGTAIPLPDPAPSYGFYYGQPYSGRGNLFGTGFWAAEYTVRSGGGQGRPARDKDRAVFEGGPLGDKVAGVGGKDGMGHGKDGKHGKHGKHGKPKPETIEVVRYIPYRYTRTVVAPRRQTTVVVMERVETHDLGRIEVTLRPRSETVSAVCLDFKGNEYPALAVKPDGAGPGYAGEIFRCEGERMLRVSYRTGATSILGSVRTADGTSYKDCDAGDALVRTADGDLRCAPKRPMSPGMERALASPAEAVETVSSGGGTLAGAGPIDISGMELTGGVGGL